MPVVGADGAERSSVRDTEKHVETLVGTVAVPRFGYQREGHYDLHPMDGALNLASDRYSFGVRKLAAKESARSSFDEVVEIGLQAERSSAAARRTRRSGWETACTRS